MTIRDLVGDIEVYDSTLFVYQNKEFFEKVFYTEETMDKEYPDKSLKTACNVSGSIAFANAIAYLVSLNTNPNDHDFWLTTSLSTAGVFTILLATRLITHDRPLAKAHKKYKRLLALAHDLHLSGIDYALIDIDLDVLEEIKNDKQFFDTDKCAVEMPDGSLSLIMNDECIEDADELLAHIASHNYEGKEDDFETVKCLIQSYVMEAKKKYPLSDELEALFYDKLNEVLDHFNEKVIESNGIAKLTRRKNDK